MNKKTIVHVISGDLWAGAEAQSFYLLKALANLNQHDLSVILFNHGILENKLIANNINTIVIDETKFNSLLLIIELRKILSTLKPSIIHVHGKKENILTKSVLIFNRAIRIVRTIHGAPEFNVPIYKLHKRIYKFVDFILIRYFTDIIIFVSDELKEKLFPGIANNRFYVIENGIDIDEVHMMAKQDISFVKNNKTVYIAIVGRLVNIKRVDIFLHVARLLANKKSNACYQFYVFGDGPLHSRLRLIATELNLDDALFFMGFKDNVIPYLSKMDILIITSDHEGLPMNLLEAVCLKTPVISHAVGGIPKVLSDGEYGHLVYHQDPDEYAKAIELVITDNAKKENQTERAYQHISTHYSSENMANKYKTIYNSL